MALLFMEGFEAFTNTDESIETDTRYVGGDVYNDYHYSTATNARIDGRALVLRGQFGEVLYKFPTSNDTVYFGFAYRPTQILSLVLLQATYNTLTTPAAQFSLYSNSGGALSVRRSTSTILGTTTGTMLIQAWNYIVLKVKINDTTGTVELWLNGIKELDLTGQDTSVSGTTVDGFKLSGGGDPDYFDDIYVGDTSGTDMTDQQGDCHIEMLTPNANGNRNNFTASPAVANYLNVDEGSPADDDTTYNHSNSVGDGELYATTSIAGSVSQVLAVQVYGYAKKMDAGDRTANLICRSSTTEVDSAAFGLSTDYQTYTGLYENDPNGGINWTETTANNAEIGFEIAT